MYRVKLITCLTVGLWMGLSSRNAQASGAIVRGAEEIVALSEMQTLAEAEQWVYLDTRCFVSLENLDDISVWGFNPTYNFIGDGGGTPVIDPATARFAPERRDLLNTMWAWQGPYVSYQRSRTDWQNIFGYDVGTPLDPWGNPYYLFTPAGLVRPPMGITLESYADQFDRYTIVSYGPDGQPGGDDDLFYSFGYPPTVLVFTSIVPQSVSVGESITIRGYNMGAAGGNVDVLFNGVAVTDGFTTWTSHVIKKTILSADPLGTVQVALRSPAGTTQPMAITINPRKNAVLFWEFY